MVVLEGNENLKNEVVDSEMHVSDFLVERIRSQIEGKGWVK
jgi:hypothetical protein